MVSISNLFEIVLKDAPRVDKKSLGSSPKFKQYLERLKSEREIAFSKPENRSVNPLRQFGKSEVVNNNPSPMKQFGVEI